MFVEIDEAVTGNISFRDMSNITINVKEGILIKSKSGAHQFIKNVYYVPRRQTLWDGQLLENGYDIHMKGHNLYLKNVDSL